MLRSLLRATPLTALALFVAPGTASAVPLTGHTIRTQYLFPDTSSLFGTPVDAVVGPGVEVTAFPTNVPTVDIDFGDSTILITMTRSGGASMQGSFDGLRFTDVNQTISPFTTVVASPTSTLSAAVVTFDADNIFVNFINVASFGAGDSVLLQLVPEPATGTILAAGFLALFALARRRAA